MSNILINIVQRRRYKIWLFGLAFGFAMFFIMFAVHTKVAAVSTCSWPGQGCGFFYGYEWPPNPNYQDGFELLNTFAQPEPANIAGNFPSYCGQQIQGAVIPQSCNGTPISKSLELQIFISDVEDNLYFGTSSNPWPQADQPLSAYDCDLQNNAQTGAAFIILSMLGLPSSDGLATNNNPNTCNPNASQAIVSVSTTYVTQWANIVTEYANGVDGFSINWNESYNSNYQTFFTGYDTGNESWHDSDWFNSPTDDPSIVFLNPSGQTVFSIDQTCGNLNYDPAALPVPSGNTPSGSFSASCSLMSGTAMDQNDPGASQGITISINGPLAPGATIQNFSTTPNATDSTWTINPASLTAPASFDGPSPPPAGWVLPSYIKSNKPFDIFVYVYGINSSGAPDGTYYYAGDQSIGPCPPQPSWTVSASASCSTLSFSFKGSPDLAKLQATGPGGAVLTYSPPIKKFPDKPSSKTFTASISNYQSGYSNTFVVQATDTSGSTGTSIASSGPCVVASITSVSASCAGPAGDVQATIDISDNIGSPGPTVYWQIDSGSTTIDNHPSGLSPSWFVDIPLPTTTASIGPHTFYAWFFSGSTKVAGSANFNCDTFPYFQVQGGDISTGSTPACITDPESNPGVYGPDGASPTIGSQLAIYALGVISGYASDQQGVTDGNTNLDFANNGPNT
ncbi:MAG TPA: hypothetical protein VMR34_00935, partial [Candidatus Saccharimonadales bacterium]|nr:hypothetical protein [Candidatus Saccharimonadales bacterium]